MVLPTTALMSPKGEFDRRQSLLGKSSLAEPRQKRASNELRSHSASLPSRSSPAERRFAIVRFFRKGTLRPESSADQLGPGWQAATTGEIS